MQSSYSVYSNVEPPDTAGRTESTSGAGLQQRVSRKSISNLCLKEDLETITPGIDLKQESQPKEFNPFAPLGIEQEVTNSHTAQTFMQQRAAKFGIGMRNDLSQEELQNENNLSTSGGTGTQQPSLSPNANRVFSLQKNNQEGQDDLKQTGGWGAISAGEQQEQMYSDSESDDLLKNSEQFYQNDDPHQISQFEENEIQPRLTADFTTGFSEVKELNKLNDSYKEKSLGDRNSILSNQKTEVHPSQPVKAKPIMLVPQVNSRTLGQEQLVQMQTGYSPLISTSFKAVNSVIKIPSSYQAAVDSSNFSVSHNSDTPSRQNSYQYGEQKSFLERMGEGSSALQKLAQFSNDPMQHTFASLAQQYQPASAQIKPSQALLTPLFQSDVTSEQSAVNPFSIANLNSEAQNEEIVTAEGFFKNPTATVKKFEAVTKSKTYARSSLPLEQNFAAQINSTKSQHSRKSEPTGPLNNLPARNFQKIPMTQQQNKQTSSNVSNTSSGVYKIKRSQIEITPATNNEIFPSEEPFALGVYNQSHLIPPTSNFTSESIWIDQFGKTPFDQTLKPANYSHQSLTIKKYPTQDLPLSSHRQTYSQNVTQNETSAQKQKRSEIQHSKSLLPKQHYGGLFSQQQERRRVGNFDPVVEQVDRSPQSTNQEQRLETQQKRYSQEKAQSQFRDVFSSGKHYRNTSEQKLQSVETPFFSGFGLESPKNLKNGLIEYQNNLNLQGGYAFKTAAKLGLLPQDNILRLNSATNAVNFPAPHDFQDIGPGNNVQPHFQNIQTSDRAQRGFSQADRFQDTISVPVFPNEVSNQNHLLFRKISSQGLMIPHSNFVYPSQLGLSTAGRPDMGLFNTPVDHFPGPIPFSQTPAGKFQDQRNIGNAPFSGGSRDQQRNRDGSGYKESESAQLNKMNSFSQGGYNNSNSVSASIRPNVSKNMPLCFRENPSQRQRRGQQANETIEIDSNNFNNGQTNVKQQPIFLQQDQQQQIRQSSNQKSRSFSNDARVILQNNAMHISSQKPTRVSDPTQAQLNRSMIPQKELSKWQ